MGGQQSSLRPPCIHLFFHILIDTVNLSLFTLFRQLMFLTALDFQSSQGTENQSCQLTSPYTPILVSLYEKEW